MDARVVLEIAMWFLVVCELLCGGFLVFTARHDPHPLNVLRYFGVVGVCSAPLMAAMIWWTFHLS
jgi:hypothetical protein